MSSNGGLGKDATSNGGGGVSLKDIQAATPAESLEEKKVLQSIESKDPTGTLSHSFDQTVPNLEETSFLDNAKITNQTSPRPTDHTAHHGNHHRRQKTVDEDMAGLMCSINDIHNETGTSSQPPPGSIFRKASKQNKTQAEDFAANAGKLFHRYQKRHHGGGEGSMTTKGAGLVESERDNNNKKRSYPKLKALREFEATMMSQRQYAWSYCKDLCCFLLMPTIGTACLLFYVFDNPGVNMEIWDEILASNATDYSSAIDSYPPEDRPLSYSYWILFWLTRQGCTFAIAKGAQFVLMSMVTKTMMFPPTVKLVMLQGRGWPWHWMFWGVTDFILMFGEGEFGRHWLFFQDYADVFNTSNPDGGITTKQTYRGILIFAIIMGIIIAAKRFIVGLVFGKNTYIRFAEKVTQALGQLLLVSKVAKFAVSNRIFDLDKVDYEVETLEEWHHAKPIEEKDEEKDDKIVKDQPEKQVDKPLEKRPSLDNLCDPRLTEEQMDQISDMLDEWEDSEVENKHVESPSLSSIVQFRASIGVLDSNWPFSPAFGPCTSREDEIGGAQKLYFNLLRKQNEMHGLLDDDVEGEGGSVLRFHTIALAALQKNGFDEDMCKDLIQLFRPARDGDIGLLEFCKSLDSLYKDVQKLRASIASESRMNAASEQIINWCFYFVLVICGLAVIGLDPVALFAILSSFILGVAFMISGASSDFFRGLLFILTQRPYDIGDRINVAGVEDDSPLGGSAGWIVKDVTLYHTTVIYAITQEYATFTNGSLSQSRIINMARSPKATVPFFMKFGLKVSSETIHAFKADLQAFVKSKPREWLNFATFRITRIESDLGFAEYIIILQHRESWQQIGAVLTSLGEAMTYAYDKSKEMKMDYEAPILPVELRMPQSTTNNGPTSQLSTINTGLNALFGKSGRT